MQNIDFNTRTHEAKINDAVDTETLDAISGYEEALEEVNMFCESKGVPLSNGFSGYVMDEGNSDKLKDKFMSPLIAENANLNNSQKRGLNADPSAQGRLIAEKADIVEEDMNIVGEKMDSSWDLFKESVVATNNLAPMMASIPPVQYLETIKCNGRLVIDHKNTDDYTFRKKREKKYVEVDGEKKYFPYAMKDDQFLDEFLNHSQPSFDAGIVTGEHADNQANLINLSGITGINADDDTIYPEVKITKIVATDTAAGEDHEAYFKENPNTVITHHKGSAIEPQFYIDTEVDGVEVTLAGRINFETGDISFQTNTNDSDYEVKEFHVEGRISGGTIKKVSSVGVEKTPMDFTIKERINMVLSYDPKSLQDFGRIENTDGLMKFTSVILDMSQHIKDHKVFKTLQEYKDMLTEEQEVMQRLEKGSGTPNDFFQDTFDPTPPDASNYKPTSPINWREDVLPDKIDNVLIELNKKFNAKSGIKNVLYGDPSMVKLIPNMTTVISKDKEYAGVSVDYDVFTMQIKGHDLRVVSTERVKSDDMKNLRIIPNSNDKEQETFTFYQQYSQLLKDNSVRDVNNVQLPSIAYIDTFDVFGIHAIMGNIEINEHYHPSDLRV